MDCHIGDMAGQTFHHLTLVLVKVKHPSSWNVLEAVLPEAQGCWKPVSELGTSDV